MTVRRSWIGIMAAFVATVITFGATGCGNSQQNAELIGQVKKIANNTPLLCPNYQAADISLGILRNGTGSMSTQDVWVFVEDPAHLKMLTVAVETGELVKIVYDEKRITWCVPDKFVKTVAFVDRPERRGDDIGRTPMPTTPFAADDGVSRDVRPSHPNVHRGIDYGPPGHLGTGPRIGQ